MCQKSVLRGRHAGMQTADMQTCAQTCRPVADMQHADMQTCRRADMQTYRHADIHRADMQKIQKLLYKK